MLPSILGLNVIVFIGWLMPRVCSLSLAVTKDMRWPDLCHCSLLKPKWCSSESHGLNVGERQFPQNGDRKAANLKGKVGVHYLSFSSFLSEQDCHLVPRCPSPWTYDPPASTSQKLELEACTTTPQWLSRLSLVLFFAPIFRK